VVGEVDVRRIERGDGIVCGGGPSTV
jgi:hypothetical protein